MPQLPEQVHPLVKRAAEFAALQKHKEFSELLWLIEHEGLHTVVEIGTHHGGSLYCWCQLAEPDAVVVSIDLPNSVNLGTGYTDERAEEIRTLFPREGQTLHLMREDSHQQSTLAELEKLLGGRRVDLLFIDGDHRYEGVKRDFQMYAPLVRSGGLIVFHDILEHPNVPLCKVSEFWAEVKDDFRHVEFTAKPYHWGGIGVLWQK